MHTEHAYFTVLQENENGLFQRVSFVVIVLSPGGSGLNRLSTRGQCTLGRRLARVLHGQRLHTCHSQLRLSFQRLHG